MDLAETFCIAFLLQVYYDKFQYAPIKVEKKKSKSRTAGRIRFIFVSL